MIADPEPEAIAEAKRLRAEAKQLVGEQRQHRGVEKCRTLDDKPGARPGRYEPTPETEARAARILSLRKRAARLHP